MGTQFTDADSRKLAELLEKQRRAKQEARNEQKRNDRMCEKLFGMKQAEVQAIIDQRDVPVPPEHDYWDEYYELKQLVERLCAVMGKDFDDFPAYVRWREERAREQAQK
jgi:hypothetical protein